MGVTCPAGEAVNPVTGLCMPPRMDMAGVDMPVTMQDSGMTQSDMSLEDMSPDMACEAGQIYNPITGMCVDRVTEDMGADMMVDLGVDMPADQGDMPAGEFGVLVGQVTRSAAPKNGGIGPVFIALFEKNPITASTSGSDPGLVAFQRIENVDFNPANTMVPYRLEGIPPRAEPYFVTAFLDDNMSADTSMPASAGPDRDDSGVARWHRLAQGSPSTCPARPRSSST